MEYKGKINHNLPRGACGVAEEIIAPKIMSARRQALWKRMFTMALENGRGPFGMDGKRLFTEGGEERMPLSLEDRVKAREKKECVLLPVCWLEAVIRVELQRKAKARLSLL